MDVAGLRILVVEDQAFVAMSIAATLQEAGAEIVGPVRTVEEAMEQVGQHGFDAVVLDLNLYGTWALPVADALARQQVPVVLLTGYEKADLPARLQSFVYCQKPWQPDRLLRAVAQAAKKG
jgi:CheY-like chemotaxis protein